jgi:hypothetical protein
VALAHLVAHQGPGSLSCWLQKQGWLPDNLGPKVTAQAPFSTQSFAIWELKIKLSQQGGSLYFTSNMIHDGPFYGNMESQAQTDIEPGELQCVPPQLGRHFEP